MFQKRYAKRWIAAGLLIVVMGVIFEALLAITGTPQDQAVNWPTVSGQVVGVTVRNTDPSGVTLAAPIALVDYRYSVSGTVYSGSQSIRRFTTSEEAQAAFPVGQALVVYYNPNAPLQSLIEPGTAETAEQPLLSGPRTVLLGTACIASIPFIGLGVMLALGGTNYTGRTSRKANR